MHSRYRTKGFDTVSSTDGILHRVPLKTLIRHSNILETFICGIREFESLLPVPINGLKITHIAAIRLKVAAIFCADYRALLL